MNKLINKTMQCKVIIQYYRNPREWTVVPLALALDFEILYLSQIVIDEFSFGKIPSTVIWNYIRSV